MRHTDLIGAAVFEMKILASDYQNTGLPRASDQWRSKHSSLLDELEHVVVSDREHRFIVDRMRRNHDSAGRTFESLCELSSPAAPPLPSAADAYALRRRLTARMDTCLLAMISDADQLSDAIYQDMMRVQQGAIVAVAVASTVLVALIFALSAMVTRTAIQPLLRLQRDSAIIGSGDLDHRTGIRTPDELGRLSRAFDSMLDRLHNVMARRDELDREVVQRKEA
jgi:methyl-accepting chemotaxis protein